MPFAVIPVVDQMQSLYKIPKGQERFEQYLLMLQGEEKSDMILPISGFNPMGDDLVVDKLGELQKLGVESKAQSATAWVNDLYPDFDMEMGIAINLTDDVGGSWSHLGTVDYTSKFDMEDLFKRGFSVAHFWTSEEYNDQIIDQRITEQLLRTLYWKDHGKPSTLADHVQQEHFVQMHFKSPKAQGDAASAIAFLKAHAASSDFNVIFNFFYGDEASKTLSYQTYGMSEINGFDFIRYHLSSQ